MSPRVRIGLISFVVLTACGEDETQVALWPEVPDALARFSVLIGADSSIQRIEGPLSEEDALTLTIESDASLFLLTLTPQSVAVVDDETLMRAEPQMDFSRGAEISIEQRVETCAEGKLIDDRARVPLIEETPLHRWSESGGFEPVQPGEAMWLNELSAEIPTRAPDCAFEASAGPFAERALLGISTVEGVRAASWIDDERVVLADSQQVLLVAKGESFRTNPSNQRFITDVLGADAILSDIAVSVGQPCSTVFGATRSSANSLGAVVSWPLCADGLGEPSVLHRTDSPGSRVALDPDGRLIVVLNGRKVLVWTSTSAPPVEHSVSAARTGLRGFAFTGDPGAPHILGGSGEVLVGDFERDSWRILELVLDDGFRTMSGAIWPLALPGERGPDLWIGTANSGVWTPTDASVLSKRGQRVPEEQGCLLSSPSCGRTRLPDDQTRPVMVEHVGRRSIWLSLDSCPFAFVFDPASQCSTLLEVAPELRDAGKSITAIVQRGNRVLVAAQDFLYEVTLE